MSDETEECIICYDAITKSTGRVDTKCGHVYCVVCFARHMRNDHKCAMCRTVLLEEPPNRFKDVPLVFEEHSFDIALDSIHNFNVDVEVYESDNRWLNEHLVFDYATAPSHIGNFNIDAVIDNAINATRVYNLFRGGLPPLINRVNNTTDTEG